MKTLFKKGDRHSWKNYRLISLLSVVGKLYESVLANRLSCLLDGRDRRGDHLLSQFQGGFRRGRSCQHTTTTIRTDKVPGRKKSTSSSSTTVSIYVISNKLYYSSSRDVVKGATRVRFVDASVRRNWRGDGAAFGGRRRSTTVARRFRGGVRARTAPSRAAAAAASRAA